MDFDDLVAKQTGLGTAAVIVMNKQTDVVKVFCSRILSIIVNFFSSQEHVMIISCRQLQGLQCSISTSHAVNALHAERSVMYALEKTQFRAIFSV